MKKFEIEITKIMKEENIIVENEFYIITTKIISDKLFKKWGSPIRVSKISPYWPKRIEKYISEHKTFLDIEKEKKRKDEIEKVKSKKKK
jgi:hypothetical protein